MVTSAPPTTSQTPCPLWARVIATGFGSGWLKPAPGTWGSLTGIFICLLIAKAHFKFTYKPTQLPWFPSLDCSVGVQNVICTQHDGVAPRMALRSADFTTALWVALFATLLGIPAASRYAKSHGSKDPSRVVVDEIAGQALALSGIIAGVDAWLSWSELLVCVATGFLLFRLFDIWKPWPIRRLEKLPGGWGIMADDLAAGAISALILATLIHLRWLPGL